MDFRCNYYERRIEFIHDATLYNSAEVISMTSATGTQCLSLSRSSDQYLASNSSVNLVDKPWTVSCWYQNQSTTASEASDVRLFSIYSTIDTTTNEFPSESQVLVDICISQLTVQSRLSVNPIVVMMFGVMLLLHMQIQRTSFSMERYVMYLSYVLH